MKIKFLLILIYPLCQATNLFSQTNNEYKNEEIRAINQILPELLRRNNDTLYFNFHLVCDLNTSGLKPKKTNHLLNKLENKILGERIIDKSEITKINGINILPKTVINSDKKSGYEYILDISRISFNKSFSTGYFYYTIYCDEDCGRGCLLKIIKKKNIWLIKKYLICFVA